MLDTEALLSILNLVSFDLCACQNPSVVFYARVLSFYSRLKVDVKEKATTAEEGPSFSNRKMCFVLPFAVALLLVQWYARYQTMRGLLVDHAIDIHGH